MQFQESLSEACGESRCGIGDTALCTCKLSCKSGQEVVLCLLRSQDGYRRKYAECVCGKEDNFFCGRSGGNRTYDLLDVVDRIGNTGVLGNALIIEIDLAVSVYGNVLKESVAFDGIVDIRLGFFVKVDNLCIASAFEVEDTVVVPAMLVVADQETLGICGQGSLAGSGKTEEDSGVLAVHICVCGAVHGSDALQRQIVVHHGEHTFLHFSAVPCVQDNLLAACDVEYNGCLGVQSQLFVVLNFGLGRVVYNEIRLEVLQFFLCGDDEHVFNEMSLPCYFHDETDRHAGVGVGAAECVYYEKSLVGELLESDILNSVPCLNRSRMVVVLVFVGCPPYSVLGILVHNDEFVFR